MSNRISGGYCGGVPPLPIPNREVKPTCADGTAMQCGRVGSRLLSKMRVLAKWRAFFRRWKHSRGFGVQSPTDYRFLRSVVNEHAPYYAYSTLDAKYRNDGKLVRKMGRLYLRLCNDRQPSVVVSLSPPSPAFEEYMHAGCRKAKVVTISPQSQSLILPEHDIFRASAQLLLDVNVDAALDAVDTDTVWVIENIHKNANCRSFWHMLTDDSRTVLCYDLYYCGIIFFDTKRYKQKYKVNF